MALVRLYYAGTPEYLICSRGVMVAYNWRIPWRLLLLASLFLAAVLLTGCFPSHSQSTFDPAGPVAGRQLDLFKLIFWTAAVVFVVVEGVLVLALFRYRRKPGQPLPKQTHGSTPLEIGWTILPVVILAVIAVPTVTTIFAQADPPPGERVEVKVVGHQWWWEFDYTQYGITTANELHVPVGKPVAIELQSDDVIHSFWIPKLAGKTDVIPTRTNRMWFQADKPGEYYGQCAELCGLAHAQMRFRVIAESQSDFDLWVAGQKTPAAVPMSSVFGIKGCTVCHTATGQDAPAAQATRMASFLKGNPQFPAPNLTHFATRSTFAAGLLDRTDENLRKWLKDPETVKPGNRMQELAGAYHNPSMALSDADINALVAYLNSLK